MPSNFYPSKNINGPVEDVEFRKVRGADIERAIAIKERFGIKYDGARLVGHIEGLEVFAVSSHNELSCVINGQRFILKIDQIIPSQNKVHVVGLFNEKGEDKGLPKSFPKIGSDVKLSGWIQFGTLASWLDFRR